MNNENTEINNAINAVIAAITKSVIEQIEPRLVALEHRYEDQTTASIKELIEECLTNTIEDAIESHDFKSSINDAISNSTISITLS